MKARFFPLPTVLVLALCILAACVSATAADKGINPTLLAKANAGDAAAQAQLGDMYNFGRGVRRDYGQALFWYRKGAEQGDAISEFQLGGLYHFGHGVPQDDAQGFAWIMKAAEQGDIDAEFFISVSYTEGWGVASDKAQSLVWLRKAAEQGHPRSQVDLGLAYATGKGVPQNYSEAFFWFDLAALGEDRRRERKEDIKVRDEVAAHLTSAELSSVQERVQKWLDDHSDERQ